MSFLKNHPFAIEAYFDQSLVCTFAFPKDELSALIPEPLTLDCYADKWAFLAVAMVQTRNLRPQGFPAVLGRDFFLIGYRIFVQYKTSDQKRLRGLYILQSETDSKLMCLLGNLLTHYGYRHIDLQVQQEHNIQTIHSDAAKLHISVDLQSEPSGLPSGSPFPDWKTARRFAGPLPFTFYVDQEKDQLTIVEGQRENWIPKPVEVLSYDFGFLKDRNLTHRVLANAFVLEKIPYRWKKGRQDQWR